MAGITATSPFTSECHAMLWRTGSVGCGRFCGGRRGRPDPKGGGRSDCSPSRAELVGKPVPPKLEAALPLRRSQRHWLSRARCRSLRQDRVLFLSCPEEQKLCFQGADHFAALRGPCQLGPER
jgi:hypothetical protein